jgi:Chaperone of endosialidase
MGQCSRSTSGQKLFMTRDMKASIKIPSFFVALTFAILWIGPLPKTQAVLPAPDGGYGPPAYGLGNTAEGQDALLSLTTGIFNTGTGYLSLQSNTTGNFNTAIGAGALFNNTADQNTATGAAALLSNTTGTFNTANGEAALFFNTTGNQNTATGAGALQSNTTGNLNTANGVNALTSNTTGDDNTAIGVNVLRSNTTGTENTALGVDALFRNTTANSNTAVGRAALAFNTTGTDNTALGRAALTSNTTASRNTAIGINALSGNTTGINNTALGRTALISNATGSDNTAIGLDALFNSTGSRNTVVGRSAGTAVTTANNVICIGANVRGADLNNSCYIGNIFGQTSAGGSAVFINANGKLGTVTSSRRFKDDIKPIDKGSETLFALKPVSFRYKKEIDPTGISQLGLVAEDVEKVNPDLVVRDEEGKPYSVRYDQVNAMLLNEFLKAHQKMEEQGATIAKQQKQIEALSADLQKVSAKLEVDKPAAQIVRNSQ